MRKLEIDPEFRDLLPVLSEDEFNQLEESMIDYGGCYDPIQIWGNTIIDGHNRYAIMQKHPEFTKFETKMLNFADRHEAIYWILQNQLGRRNLDGIARDLIVARAYKEQMQVQRENRRLQKIHSSKTRNYDQTVNGKGHAAKTRQKVAKDFGIGRSAVSYAYELKQGLDAADAVSSGFTDKVLSGEIKVPKTERGDTTKIPLKEYAQRLGKNPQTARHRAERGSFNSAEKIGRDWFIDEHEIWKDNRITTGVYVGRNRNRKQREVHEDDNDRGGN